MATQPLVTMEALLHLLKKKGFWVPKLFGYYEHSKAAFLIRDKEADPKRFQSVVTMIRADPRFKITVLEHTEDKYQIQVNLKEEPQAE